MQVECHTNSGNNLCITLRKDESRFALMCCNRKIVVGVGVAWQTGSDNIGIFPEVVNNPEKFGIMRDMLYGVKIYRFRRSLCPISLLVR